MRFPMTDLTFFCFHDERLSKKALGQGCDRTGNRHYVSGKYPDLGIDRGAVQIAMINPAVDPPTDTANRIDIFDPAQFDGQSVEQLAEHGFVITTYVTRQAIERPVQ